MPPLVSRAALSAPSCLRSRRAACRPLWQSSLPCASRTPYIPHRTRNPLMRAGRAATSSTSSATVCGRRNSTGRGLPATPPPALPSCAGLRACAAPSSPTSSARDRRRAVSLRRTRWARPASASAAGAYGQLQQQVRARCSAPARGGDGGVGPWWRGRPRRSRMYLNVRRPRSPRLPRALCCLRRPLSPSPLSPAQPAVPQARASAAVRVAAMTARSLEAAVTGRAELSVHPPQHPQATPRRARVRAVRGAPLDWWCAVRPRTCARLRRPRLECDAR